MTDQPSEVKEGGALDLDALKASLAIEIEEAGRLSDATPFERFVAKAMTSDDAKSKGLVDKVWIVSLPDARKAIAAITEWNAARPPSMERGEAEGWRLVPVEPTEEMLFKGWKATGTVIIPAIRVAYAAMLAAAPSPAPSAVPVTPENIALASEAARPLQEAYARGYRAKEAERENDLSPSAVEMAGVERDAARWRAFINCGHIKMQGWAACDANGDRMSVEDRPIGSVHFGAEFWVNDGRDQLPTGATHDQAGRKVVTAFADDCIAAGLLALATASREKGPSSARELKPAADMSAAEQPQPRMSKRYYPFDRDYENEVEK